MQETTAEREARQEVEESLKRAQRIIDMDWLLLGKVALVGFVLGAIAWSLALLLQTIVVDPIFCRPAANAAACGKATGLAFNGAAVLLGVIGVGALVKLSVYRPLVIVLAVIATLWSAQGWLGELSWIAGTIWLAIFYAFSYALYSWIVRIYNLPLAVGVTIAVMIIARIVINS